jgi:hypothetical protein
LLESTVEAATLVAAGPTAAAAISASVASLSEGVLKTMLIAKLKGIFLAVGTMTAVVSGAVVLAQSGSGTGSGPKAQVGVPRVSTLPAPDVAEWTREHDRTAAMEKKLDRFLDVLERFSRMAPPPGANVASDPSIQPAVPPSVSRPHLGRGVAVADLNGDGRLDVAPSASAVQPPPRPPDAPNPPQATMPPPRPPDAPSPPRADRFNPAPPPTGAGPYMPPPTRAAPMSLADRMQVFEQQMQEVQQRLERLERHLNALDARVGGAEVEQLPRPAPPMPPMPPPAS